MQILKSDTKTFGFLQGQAQTQPKRLCLILVATLLHDKSNSRLN